MKPIKRTSKERLEINRSRDISIKNKIRGIERAVQMFQDDIDGVPPNFYAMVVGYYGNINYPKCNSVLAWIDDIWKDIYEPAKNEITNGGDPTVFFDQVPDRPHSFDDCKTEIISQA